MARLYEAVRVILRSVKAQADPLPEGHVYLPYKQFLGYRKGEDGKPEIVEEEAQIVRRIYAMFLEGKTPYGTDCGQRTAC